MTARAPLSRRRFLHTTALAAGATVLAPGLATQRATRALAHEPHSEGPVPLPWSVVHDGGYVALAMGADGVPDLFDLETGGDGRVTGAARRHVGWPHGLLPEAIVPLGGQLLAVGGRPYLADRLIEDDGTSVLEGDRADLPPEDADRQGGDFEVWSSEPAAAVVEGSRARPHEVPAGDWAFGIVASGVAVDGRLVLAIQHSPSLEASYGASLSIAESGSAGWSVRELAAALGEAWPATLASTDRGLLLGVEDGGGVVHLRERPARAAAGAAWRPVPAPADGALLALAGGERTALIARPEGGVARQWLRASGGGWREGPPLALDGDGVETVVPVTGTDEVLVVGHAAARLL